MGGRQQEGVRRCVEGGSEWGHPRGETSGSGANELSQGDEHLLVGPNWGLRRQVRDTLEEAGSLTSGGGAGKDGMFEGLWGSGAQGAGRVGIRVVL